MTPAAGGRRNGCCRLALRGQRLYGARIGASAVFTSRILMAR